MREPSLTAFLSNLQNYTLLAVINAFQVRGRASRREFWYFFLAIVLGHLLISLIWAPNSRNVGDYWELATLVPFATLQMRRLHDQNAYGIFAYITPIALGLRLCLGDYTSFGGSSFESIFYNNVRMIIDFADFSILVMCAFAGDSGENDYGPPSGL